MKTIKLLVCAVLLSSAMIGCGSRSAQNGEAENTNAVEKTEEEIANAVPKPIELGPNDILEFGELGTRILPPVFAVPEKCWQKRRSWYSR